MVDRSPPRVLIVGHGAPVHIGARLLKAGQDLALPVELLDIGPAYATSRVVLQINWRLRGHRPPRLDTFSAQVVQACAAQRPDVLLVTGIAPVNAQALRTVRELGIVCANYLTDDPWNPAHNPPWFLRALPHYHVVFTPRRANAAELAQSGVQVHYLPFAYDPALHFPEPPPSARQAEFASDVLFYGGADADRVPYIAALAAEDVRLHLYGGYWERRAAWRPYHRGMAEPQTLRWAVSGAKVTLCLVRRANRDGHTMRSFEVPAMQGCMLVEDTAEHREIFGQDGELVVYFETISEMVRKLHGLLADDAQRHALARRAHDVIVSGSNTYADRLRAMLAAVAPLLG